ncbi:MAG: hypothetical protein JWP10_805, partial [Nocardioidaceae bacterium]|nr:hypothetical protein [Nocardioidaceae bacterium]
MSTHRRSLTVAAIALSLVVLSGCSALSDFTKADPKAAATAATTAAPVLDSQFTKDGTFQSHEEIDGLDFVYTLWPTKSTPRTNEWFPLGNKYFSFTFQAYDLDQEIRDPFKTKRRVYLDQIRVTSATVTASGVSEAPYELNGRAKRLTWDPQPLTSKYGMMITNPKGSFEIRNQEIGPLAMDTYGINLTFEATVFIQRSAGSKRYEEETIRQVVPIQIFASKTPTVVTDIPV